MKIQERHQPRHSRLVTCQRFLATALATGALAASAHAGVLLDLYYGFNTPITGNAVTNLTQDPTYPSSPDYYDVLTAGLASPVNFSDNYGRLIRGYIEAPETGNYTFWIASDDDSELWLSTSTDPAGKALIAQNVGAVGLGDYTEKAAQRSAPISLVAGQKYYFEVLHKEGVGGDFVSVMWQLPDGTSADPVPETHLWPFPVDTTALPSYSATPLSEGPTILTSYAGIPVDYLQPALSTTEGSPLDLTISADGTQPVYVQWYRNGVAIPNANLLTYHINATALADNGAVYSVTITNTLGQATASTTLSVSANTAAPTLVDALNLGNFAGDIAVVFSEAVEPASATVPSNYSLNGATVTGARMGATANTVLLQTSGLTAGTSYTLTVNNVRSAAATPVAISAGSTIPLEQNLDTWLRLDEVSGPTVSDSSGNSHDGSLSNGVATDYAGKVLRAVKLNGVNGYVNLPPGYSDFTGQGLTVALWSHLDTTVNDSWARFFDLGNGPANDNILFARSAASDMLTFEVYKNPTGSGGKVTTRSILALNQWQHLAATLDPSGNVVIYVNGQPLVTNVTAVPNPVLRTNNYVGRSNWGGDGYLGGEVDDVRVYDRVLSPAAIAALAAGGGADDSDPALPVVSIVATVPQTAEKNTPPGVFTVSRTGSTSSALTVDYVLGGTATNGVAYTLLPDSVTIPAGAASAQVQVVPIDYAFTEPVQTVTLTCAGNAGYLIAAADSDTVTIVNNDLTSPPVPVLATADDYANGLPSTVDVWFNEVVTLPSATNLVNYTLSPATVSITNATLTSQDATSSEYHLRVVLNLSGPLPDGTTLTVTGVQDPAGNTVTTNLPVHVRAASQANIVANVYHGAAGDRPTAFAHVTDGVVNNSNNNGTGFDTFNGNAGTTQFGGLLYSNLTEFLAIKVDLGQQFSDGGSWTNVPYVYILTNPVDTASSFPESNTNWARVPAQLISNSKFQMQVDPNPSPNTPIVFDLSGVPAAERTGYGWAVGGVFGNGNTNLVPFANRFISLSELRAYGTGTATPAIAISPQPANLTVQAGQRGKFSAGAQSVLGLTYQWEKNGAAIPGATASYYAIPPAVPADNGAVFTLVANNAIGSLTSQPATLTVLNRTTPPNVVAAALDTTNSTFDVWFDESVDPATALNVGNFGVNDPGLTLYGAAQDANGFRVVLSFSGTPTLANLTLGVTNIADLSGNIQPLQTVPVLSLVNDPTRVVANEYQQGRVAAFTRSTDGQVVNDANVSTWTTFGGPQGASDFVGVGYAEPQVFGVVKVDLGWQFADGGDWGFQPKVYIQKTPADTNQKAPETDPADWVEVPATLISGNIFDMSPDGPAGTVPPPNTPIAFDLSHLPLSQRTGYAWAVGGVQGNGPNAQFVSIAELRSFGAPASSLTNVTGAPQLAVDVAPSTQTLPGGAPLSLGVVAAGSSPLHYQWLFNGAPLNDNNRITGSGSAVLNIASTLPADSGTYQVIVTNSFGAVTGSLASVTVTGVAFNNGGGWTPNGNAVVATNTVSLTDGATGEASSSFLSYPVYIGAFTATWTYQDIGGGGADGTVFVIQNDPRGPSALGGGGGGLGYSGITPSAGVEFNIYAGNQASTTSSGLALRENGLTGKPYADATPINPASGHPLGVTVQYDGSTLSLVVTDAVAGVSFSTNWVEDLSTTLGTNVAWVGFTGASGGVASKQHVSNFAFYNQCPLQMQVTGPNAIVLSWPATSIGFELQETSSLGAGSWTTVNNSADLVNGNFQVQVTPGSGDRFYRLALP